MVLLPDCPGWFFCFAVLCFGLDGNQDFGTGFRDFLFEKFAVALHVCAVGASHEVGRNARI